MASLVLPERTVIFLPSLTAALSRGHKPGTRWPHMARCHVWSGPRRFRKTSPV